jgi:hypothetical protein
VEEKHCGVFEQQGITGDVLPEMDRLKAWQTIKAF